MIDEDLVKHIVNITIVDGELNKNIIKDKAPSNYMLKLKKDNPNLKTTMDSHLIDDVDAFGIWNDDHSVFFEKRTNKEPTSNKSI